jgi:hypothetical protein
MRTLISGLAVRDSTTAKITSTTSPTPMHEIVLKLLHPQGVACSKPSTHSPIPTAGRRRAAEVRRLARRRPAVRPRGGVSQHPAGRVVRLSPWPAGNTPVSGATIRRPPSSPRRSSWACLRRGGAGLGAPRRCAPTFGGEPPVAVTEPPDERSGRVRETRRARHQSSGVLWSLPVRSVRRVQPGAAALRGSCLCMTVRFLVLPVCVHDRDA